MPEVQVKKIDSMCSTIQQRIHWAGTDPAMAQLHNDWGSYEQDFLDYMTQEPIQQPHNSFNHRSSFLAPTEASMQILAVLPVGTSAIASRRLPIFRSNNNSNDIINIITITAIENTE